MIYMIYAPTERPQIENFVDDLSEDYEVRLAPAGLQAGSDAWLKQVEKDILLCHTVIIMLTDISVRDQTVATRFSIAAKAQKNIIPITFQDFDYSRNAEYLIGDFAQIARYNALRYIPEYHDDSVARLKKRFLIGCPKKKKEVALFLSYSRKDTDFTIKLAADLREAKLKTWRDAENIPAGANWDREIEKAVKECTYLILVASPNSVESENVMDEVSIAINKGKTVIPVMIETCELPMRVHRAQWVDFRDGYDEGLKKLLEQLGEKKSD